MDRSSTNFNLLRTKYPRVEWDDAAKVKDLALHIHDQRLLSEHEWVHLEGSDLPSDQGMFFMPEEGATFYVQGRLQYFWVYFSQFRVLNDMSVKKIGCDDHLGIEMTPMSIVGNRMLSTSPQSRVGPARFT